MNACVVEGEGLNLVSSRQTWEREFINLRSEFIQRIYK